MASHPTRSDCGIRVAASSLASTREAVAQLGAELDGGSGLQHIVLFFGIDHDAATLVQALNEAFPGIPVSGCSTAGEIGPSGMMQGALVAIGFPRDGFRVHSELITDIDRSGVEHATDAVRRLKARVSPKAERLPPSDMFGVLLVDGLSNAEETLVAAVHWAFDDMQLIGGSAGDGLAFRKTSLIHEGRVARPGRHAHHDRERFSVPHLQDAELRADADQARRHGRRHGEPHRPRAQRGAGGAGIRVGHRADARRSRAVQLRLLSAGGQSRRRLLLPLDPQHEPRRQPVVLLRHRRRSRLHRGTAAGYAQLHGADAARRSTRRSAASTSCSASIACCGGSTPRRGRSAGRWRNSTRSIGWSDSTPTASSYNAMHLNQTLTGVAFGPADDGGLARGLYGSTAPARRQPEDLERRIRKLPRSTRR